MVRLVKHSQRKKVLQKRLQVVISLSFFIVLGAVMINGCSRRLENSQKKVSIRWFIYADVSQGKIYRKMKDAFERSHPAIKVVLELCDWTSYEGKLLTMIVGNTAPDVFVTSIQNDTSFASKGILVNLDPYIEKSKFNISDIFPQALEACRYNGHIYGIPKGVSTTALFYNKDLFDSAGVNYPDETWDWNIFLEACRKLTKDIDGDGRIDQFGCSVTNWSTVWTPLVWQNGGKVYNDLQNPTECLLDQPEAYEAIQFYVDLVHRYHVAPTVSQQESVGDMFTAGKMATLVSWRAYVPGLRAKAMFNWDVAPLPKGKRRATILLVLCFGVSTQTKYPEESWELVKFLGGEEGQRILSESGQDIPTRKSVAYSEDFSQPKLPPQHDSVFLDALEYGYLGARIQNPKELSDLMRRELDMVFLGKVSAEEACKKLKADIDKMLKK
ncbi:MAG: sugar ABC transporter substrate-binding protein [bacterium]